MPSKFKPTRQRKHKTLARDNKNVSTENTNHVVINNDKTEREARRQKLRDELRSQQPKISSKKQKRLDKYIENKLKKEENLDLLKKLAKEKEKYDARGLQSSKHLRKRGFEEFLGDQPGWNHGHEIVDNQTFSKNSDVIEDSDMSEDSFEHEHQEAFGDRELLSDEAWLQKKTPNTLGIGLAQPLKLGVDGLPIVPSRTSRKQQKPNSANGTSEQKDYSIDDSAQIGDDEEVWEGFGSGDDIEDAEDEDLDSSVEENADSMSSSSNSENASSENESLATSEDDSENEKSAALQNGKIKPRASAFKAWATQQLNHSMGHVPSYEQQQVPEVRLQEHAPSVRPTAGYQMVIEDVPMNGPNRIAYSVHVERASSIQDSRQRLPILQREQEIMEAIHNNPVVIVKGDTGSGKTTQVPQFLFEAGYGDQNGPTPGLIGVAQPRRVAAVSMAARVAEELGSHGDKVAHQIRFETTASSSSAIKFMTDGILLRELSQDLLLKKYSAIIIDEAHERSVNTDLLIGMLSKIVPARLRKTELNPDPKPLKLIIMSATLDISEFLSTRLFGPGATPPIVEAEGRQHRVTTHFALRSRADYLEETIEKVKKAHRKLPRGGILVFLTGQNEIKHALTRLQKDLKQHTNHNLGIHAQMRVAASDAPVETDDMDFGIQGRIWSEDNDDDIDILADEDEDDGEFEVKDEDDGESGVGMSGVAPSRKKDRSPYDSVHLLPLFSQLPTRDQLRVFEPPPERSRLIVLATNVAETSLTIPGIRFVFDCGRSKERKYNLDTGVQSFEIGYISKASAQQRAGRAGRTAPGHCWRLYSSAVYEQFFPEHAQPEILRTPAESVVLQLKGFRYPRPVSEFPFPTSPSQNVLAKAEKLLRNLGAISTVDGSITDLGKQLSAFPLSPRLGKILVKGTHQPTILTQVLYLVAGLSVGEIFVQESQAFMTPTEKDEGKLYTHEQQQEDEEREHQKQQFRRANATLSRQDKSSDALKIITAITMYCEASHKEGFCKQHFLRPKAMAEIFQLTEQLRGIVKSNHPGIFESSSKEVKQSSGQARLINSIAASGYVDQVAVRWDLAPTPPALSSKPRKAIEVPYLPLIPLKTHSGNDSVEKVVFIHPSSVLSRLSTKDLPQYIVYIHLQQAQGQTVGSTTVPKTRMLPLSALDASTFLQLIRETALIEYGKPVQNTKIEEIGGTPKRRICWVTTQVRGGGAGTFAWPLPPSRVKQVMDMKSSTGWRVEEILA